MLQELTMISTNLDSCVYIYIRLITRVSVRYGEIFHEPKASEISRHISQLTSVISALFLEAHPLVHFPIDK